MSLSIVTIADLGKVKNLKTADIVPIINSFTYNKKLVQVICRRQKSFFFPRTQAAVPVLKSFVAKIIASLPGKKASFREIEKKFIDDYAASKLEKCDVVLFHPASFKRSVKRAKEAGAVTVGVATSASHTFVDRLMEEEFSKLDLPMYDTFQKKKIRKYRNLVNEFDYIIAFSDFVKESYIQEGVPGENIYVGISDIDRDKFVPSEEALTNDTFRVLYAASTTPLKGLQYLLDAWTQLDMSDIEMVIAGGYKNIPTALDKRFKNTIENDPRIIDIGHTDSMVCYYQEASVFVLPSLTEGNPRVVMEALACGVPVITTEHAKSIIEDGINGFIVPIRDPGAIREKIKFLYDNPDILQEMRQAARRSIENKKEFGEKVFEIYQDILQREHRV